MRGGAQPNDRLTRVRKSLDMPHLLFREITKARENNHQIRFLEHVQSGNVMHIFRVDHPALRVYGVKRRGFETVPERQDAGQLGERFFGSIFFVSAYKNDVLALTGSFSALVHNPGRVIL